MEEQSPWIDHLKPERSPREIKRRTTAKKLGLIAAAVGVPVTFYCLAGSFQSDWNPFLVYAGVSCLLRFIVLWFALGFPFLGGLILIGDGMALGAFYARSYDYGVVYKIVSLPALLSLLLISSGILFFLVSRERYRHKHEGSSPK